MIGRVFRRASILGRTLGLWLLATLIGCVVVYQRAGIDRSPPPPPAARTWALSALEAVRRGQPPPAPPAEVRGYRAQAGVLVELFHRGTLIRSEAGSHDLVEAVTSIAERLRADERLALHPGWGGDATHPILFAIAVPRGEAPLLDGIPGLSLLSLVPLREGLIVEPGDGRRLVLSPHAIWAEGLLDRAVVTPIPDLSFGTSPAALRELAAERLAVSADRLRGRMRRFAADTWTAADYPNEPEVTVERLRAAARAGARFLLRHQRRDGRYTYVYDAHTGRSRRSAGYSLARHAGTTFFLSQAARMLGMPEAREGARRALRWVRRHALARCGEAKCVGGGRLVTLGGSALTALAAAEWLRTGNEIRERELLEALSAHIRAVQRPDGELMHDFDRRAHRPIDKQRMYYSGEAALALLTAHDVLGDERDLQVVKRLMGHLTGGGWSFFGSRFFYGEEHWTCQAVGAASGTLDVDKGLDFCLRWSGFQRRIQYGAGQTPWPASGTYGVGPVLLPRITAVASRVEAGVPIYRAARARGDDVRALRAQLEASVEALMRFRWDPGPVHLMGDPVAALGGFPMTQASLEVRNDFVQHAGSAMLAWAELLSEENATNRP